MDSQLFDTLYVLLTPITMAMVGVSVGCWWIVAYDAGLDQVIAELQGRKSSPQGSSAIKELEKAVLRKLAKYNVRYTSEPTRAKIQRKMIMAGVDMLPDPLFRKPEEFISLQEVAGVGCFLAILYVCNALGKNLVYSLIGLPFGIWMTGQWLNDQITKRHLQITRALPYNLDLLTLSVEAGLDFTGALQKVVDKGRKGPLLDELNLLLRQLKMGKTRADSLRIMVERVNLPSLTTFVTSLISADKMGTPLGRVLRIQSQVLRVERSQRAEKLANEAPVKMLGPLIMCIFPTVFVIIFGPIGLQLTKMQK